jgi:RNA polymerase sigma-70 factor (ECF subfamily)
VAESERQPARWLAEARSGSKEALGEALEACRAYLLMVAQRELDPELRAKGGASDLVQQTFLEAQRDFRRFQGASEGELRAWLRQVLLNNLANFTRSFRGTAKRRVDREVGLHVPGDSSAGERDPSADTLSPSGRVMKDEGERALQEALARLPEDHRRVIRLRYDENRSFEEIARAMNRSPNAARKLWARAIERLEQELGPTP